MRKRFGELIASAMAQDDRIWLLSGDLGFGVLNQARTQFPQRFCNVGAAEQLMLGTAVGLAHSGRIPVCYSITPFVIFRPYEYLRNYLDHEMCPVKLVGAGRGQDYGHLGFSHWADDANRALDVFRNIDQFMPETEQDLDMVWTNWLYSDLPAYLNLRRQV
jgi:transketolase